MAQKLFSKAKPTPPRTPRALFQSILENMYKVSKVSVIRNTPRFLNDEELQKEIEVAFPSIYSRKGARHVAAAHVDDADKERVWAQLLMILDKKHLILDNLDTFNNHKSSEVDKCDVVLLNRLTEVHNLPVQVSIEGVVFLLDSVSIRNEIEFGTHVTLMAKSCGTFRIYDALKGKSTQISSIDGNVPIKGGLLACYVNKTSLENAMKSIKKKKITTSSHTLSHTASDEVKAATRPDLDNKQIKAEKLKLQAVARAERYHEIQSNVMTQLTKDWDAQGQSKTCSAYTKYMSFRSKFPSFFAEIPTQEQLNNIELYWNKMTRKSGGGRGDKHQFIKLSLLKDLEIAVLHTQDQTLKLISVRTQHSAIKHDSMSASSILRDR